MFVECMVSSRPRSTLATWLSSVSHWGSCVVSILTSCFYYSSARPDCPVEAFLLLGCPSAHSSIHYQIYEQVFWKWVHWFDANWHMWLMGQGHGMNSGVTRDRFGGLDAIRLSSFSSFVASLLVDKLFVSVSVVLMCRVMYMSRYRFWRLCEDRDLMIYCYGSNCSSVPLVDLHWRRLVHCNISGKKAKLQLVWQQ